MGVSQAGGGGPTPIYRHTFAHSFNAALHIAMLSHSFHAMVLVPDRTAIHAITHIAAHCCIIVNACVYIRIFVFIAIAHAAPMSIYTRIYMYSSLFLSILHRNCANIYIYMYINTCVFACYISICAGHGRRVHMGNNIFIFIYAQVACAKPFGAV